MIGLFTLQSFAQFNTTFRAAKTVITMTAGFFMFESAIMLLLKAVVQIISSVFIFFETEVKFAVKTVIEADV